MKTIQIPTNSNPFIVNINNNVYQYRAGDTIEVPDDVAEAIEDALELVPKPKSTAMIGGTTFVVEVNEDITTVLTPLNDIRDAWQAGRVVILPIMRSGYTNVFTLVTGGVSVENGNFVSARFGRVSEVGIETYLIDKNAKLIYSLMG